MNLHKTVDTTCSQIWRHSGCHIVNLSSRPDRHRNHNRVRWISRAWTLCWRRNFRTRCQRFQPRYWRAKLNWQCTSDHSPSWRTPRAGPQGYIRSGCALHGSFWCTNLCIGPQEKEKNV